MTCTACEEGRCDEVFVCEQCRRLLNACNYRIGGLDGPDYCSTCWEVHVLHWPPPKNFPG